MTNEEIKTLADGYYAGNADWLNKEQEQATKVGWRQGFAYALRQFAVSGSISSMKETMDSFFQEIEEEIKAEPNNMKLIGARWAYRIAMEQFNNRFKKYYR